MDILTVSLVHLPMHLLTFLRTIFYLATPAAPAKFDFLLLHVTCHTFAAVI